MPKKHVEYGLEFLWWKSPSNRLVPIVRQTISRGPNSALTFIEYLTIRECDGFISDLQRNIEAGRTVDEGFESDSVENMKIAFEYPNVNVDDVQLISMDDMRSLLMEWKDFMLNKPQG